MSQRAIAYVESLHALLTDGEYAVAQALATLARDQDDVAEATMAQIGAAAGLNARNARKHIRALESYGLLVQVYQKKGLYRSRTTYRWLELDAARPQSPPDQATIINLEHALRRKAEAARDRADASRMEHHRDPLLLAALYEEMARRLRAESGTQAKGNGA